MESNFAFTGGCLRLISSELIAIETEFVDNIAYEGGVFDVSGTSMFEISSSKLTGNYAVNAAIINILAKSKPSNEMRLLTLGRVPFRFERSEINYNKAFTGLAKLTKSEVEFNDCQIVDNIAKISTHGFSVESSKLYVYNSYIAFKNLTPKESEMEKLDTGFINLVLNSELHLANTKIEGMRAYKQAVLTAWQSSVYIKSNVEFVNNLTVAKDGTIMAFWDTNEVKINGATFK